METPIASLHLLRTTIASPFSHLQSLSFPTLLSCCFIPWIPGPLAVGEAAWRFVLTPRLAAVWTCLFSAANLSISALGLLCLGWMSPEFGNISFRGNLKEAEDLSPALKAFTGWCGWMHVGEMLQSSWKVSKNIIWSRVSVQGAVGGESQWGTGEAGWVRPPGALSPGWEFRGWGRVRIVGENEEASQALDAPPWTVNSKGRCFISFGWFLSVWHKVDA